MSTSVALIGYGAIAREIHTQIGKRSGNPIRQVLVRPARRDAVQAEAGAGTGVISALNDLHPDVNFVLECAGHEAVRTFGPAILTRGISFGIVSVGALAEDDVHRALVQAAREGGGQLVILPGAIGGTDAIAAAGPDNLTAVSYTGCKPPLAWAGSPAENDFDLSAISARTVLFSGTAREAARRYPRNANVVATVALAGTGFDKTVVSLVADPEATGNTHHISAKGPLLDLSYTTGGAPLASNPRTSALTAMSALRALRNLTGDQVI